MIGDRNQILTRLINTYRKALKSSNLAYTILLEQGQILQNNDFPCTLWAVQGLYGSVVNVQLPYFFLRRTLGTTCTTWCGLNVFMGGMGEGAAGTQE